MRRDAGFLARFPLYVVCIAVTGCGAPAVTVEPVSLTAAIESVLHPSPQNSVDFQRAIGNSVDRGRGRQHDSYSVRTERGDTALHRRITASATSVLLAAGWRTSESHGLDQTYFGEFLVAESAVILKRGNRDGSLHVIWNGRSAPALYTVVVDLAGNSGDR